jgi:hypothetical protein
MHYALLVFFCCSAVLCDELVPFKVPEGTEELKKEGRPIGWKMGLETNYLNLYKAGGAGRHVMAISPLRVDNRFQSRSISTAADWEKLAAQLRKKVGVYFGVMPSMDIPLDHKTEESKDYKDYIFSLESIAFNKEHRGKMGILIPKGIQLPAPAIIMYDGYGGGIKRACQGVYSRASAVHFARYGFIVVVLNHWDDRFGKSSKLCTAGAATHMVRRTVQYLVTRKDLVNPKQIGYWGHVYGGDLMPFIASHVNGISSFAVSCSVQAATRNYTADFWSPPFWAHQGANMGIATQTSPKMYYSQRSVQTSPLPFLTQEIIALAAPRPVLAVNSDNAMFDCIRPVWKLYGKDRFVEMIQHKWKQNQPVNARDYTVDFFLRTLVKINPGNPSQETVSEILKNLRSENIDTKIKGAYQAGWWKCTQAADTLKTFLTHEDVLLRRVSAKALQRIGAMKELLPHLDHEDPAVRLFVVETFQMHGTEEAFDTLVENDQDDDKWVNEAKWQSLQVNPWE